MIQNMRIFMGMQAKDISIFVLIWKASFLLAIKRITPGLYAIAFLIAISGVRQFPDDNKCCFLRI